MRKLLLIILTICIAGISNSQTRRTGQVSTTSTGSKPITETKKTKVANGDVLLHTMKGLQKIYATYVNSKITGYYAIDTKGKIIPARMMTKGDGYSTRKLKCYTCLRVVDADTGKSAEECEEIPCPDSITGEKATIRTAQ